MFDTMDGFIRDYVTKYLALFGSEKHNVLFNRIIYLFFVIFISFFTSCITFFKMNIYLIKFSENICSKDFSMEFQIGKLSEDHQ